MTGDILSIGKSGLFAAQAGLATTGNNIANANVAGYSRQVVLQATALSIQSGYGFSGTGTQIAEIKRYSDAFLNAQVQTAQASKSALDAYGNQINQVDNLLSDSTAGLSPALQNFFASVQDVTGNHASDSSRQGMMSGAETLAARFQSIDARLQQVRDGVNTKIQSNVTLINSYAQQIAQLNDQIAGFAGDSTRQPNDLLDKRDQLVLQLNQQVKATVTPGDNNSYNVSIGSGMPLVVGKQTYQLVATTSPTDQSRIEVGYQTANKVTVLPENSLPGGELGGLMDFRANSLDRAQNAFGRIAIGVAMSFNDQNKLGLDQQGQPGKNMFTYGQAFIGQNINNNVTSTTALTATVSNPSQLTDSDYKVAFDGTNFSVTRLSDNTKTTIAPYPQVTPQTIDGVDFAISGAAAAGDNFVVRPTVNGAGGFKLALTDRSQIAAAAPIATSATTANTGTVTISPGSVNASYLASPLAAPVTLTYSAATGQLNGFPAAQAVTVTAGGVTTAYAPGAAIPYQSDATYSFGGISFTMSGVPKNNDTFTIARNTGVGDVRNAGLMAGLQTKNIFSNGNANVQTAYAGLVGLVGNKAREVQVNGDAGGALLSQVKNAAQDVSGVNLDEEATNLLRYQQAYQACGKIMQVASTVFDTLISIGH